MARITKKHMCEFTAKIVAEYRNIGVEGSERAKTLVPGSGITVWKMACSCGVTYYSVSHWENSQLSMGKINIGGGKDLPIKTPLKEKEDSKPTRRRRSTSRPISKREGNSKLKK